ncbi:hypothetical protein JIG36_31390 [Actinoplanes sp. LDG1-06]|uniref:VCBS repeat-containing protein n=1 Tax=Paractinoplanes ovalisporus TaxID=2810368 RepID=A0ABS2AJK4_9ACTN|nr:hypothetical protein [Actinoplanes ovalisporus]MBM2620027.1 hypothetical protein [Actinoplanes ovalisporus]
MRVALAAVVAVTLLAAGGVIAWSLRSPATVGRVTAASGGTVTTDEGVSVRFGPGALTADAEVRIVPRPSIEAPDGLGWIAEPVDISLRGAALRTSATVTLPLREEPADGLLTVVSRDGNRVWSSQGGTLDRAARTISTTVGQLSILSAGRAVVTTPDVTGGAGAYEAPDPDCGTTRSQRWTARAEGEAVKTCVAAGATDRPALMRVVSNRTSGQFAELGHYPPITLSQPNRASVADTVWRKLGEADRDHTFLPAKGELDISLPGNLSAVDFVTRTGPDVAVAEYIVQAMSSAFVPAEVTVKAVQCALALPLDALDGRVAACVSDAFAATPLLAEGVADNQARADRADVRGAVIAAMHGLPGVAASLPTASDGWRVIAERSPVIPGKALNEPGGSIPAAVVTTQERLYAAATRDSLTDALPPSGLVFANTSLTGPRVSDAVAALVTTPPLRWPCDETSRDGYVYGLADPNLLTYPARLTDLGLPPEDVGIVRQTAGRGKNYRLCIALDGTWTSLVAATPPGDFPQAEAAKLGALGSGACRATATNPFVPPDSTCRTVVRADLDGDSRTDTLLLFERAGRWTARSVLAAGRTSDVELPFASDDVDRPFDGPVVLDSIDLDGEPGEEIALRGGAGLWLLSLTSDGLVLIDHRFETAATPTRTAGLGCADLNRDGRPELVSGSATLNRDPRTGAIVGADTVETRWTWTGKTLVQAETIRRQLTGPQAAAAAAPPYREITCTWK